MEVAKAAGNLALAAAGVGLFVVGAWGSLRIPRLKVDLVLNLKQRIQCTGFGLLLLAVAYFYFAG
jgi:hypothetical protein